jgi:hypothetical protein
LDASLPHQHCGEVSGSDVSEGMCEAPTFMEWSTMVVPSYPEGGSHALQVCASTTIRLCESATLSGCQILKEHVARNCAPADSAETFTVRQVERRDQARSRGKAVLGSPFGPRGRPLHAAVPSGDASLFTPCSSNLVRLNTFWPAPFACTVREHQNGAFRRDGSAWMSSAGSRRGSSHALVPWNREQACSASGPSGGHAFSGRTQNANR